MNKIYNGLCGILMLLGMLTLLGSVDSPYLSTEEVILCGIVGITAIVVGYILMDRQVGIK